MSGSFWSACRQWPRQILLSLLVVGFVGTAGIAACGDTEEDPTGKDSGGGDLKRSDGPARQDKGKDGPLKGDGAKDGPKKGDAAKPDGPLKPDQKVACKVDTDCLDKLFCTTNLCKQGSCTLTIQTGYCAVGPLCVYKSTINPGNKCQKCDPAVSSMAWSPHAGGTCDDKVACTHSDMCGGGVCKGMAYSCDDKLSCTTDTCTGKPNGCTYAVSSGQCKIQGKCLKDGIADPKNACRKCDASKNSLSWSQVTPVAAACPWAVSGGGTLSDDVQGIGVDAGGNSYVVGFFKGTATLGGTKLQSKGDNDVFVAKVSPLGKILWATGAGGADYDVGLDIAVDSAGNSRITGYFKGTASFGSSKLTSSGNSSDIFVAGLNSGGSFQWAVSAGGTSADYGKAIALDKAGASHVLATFSGTGTFAGKSFNALGTADNIVLKVSSTGSLVRGVPSGGIGGESGTGIAVDGAGGVYFTGGYFTSAQFGTININNINTKANDIYVAKMDANGKFKWAFTVGSAGSDYPGDIVIDASGKGALSGHCGVGASVGGSALAGGGFFVARFDSGTGKVGWLNPSWGTLSLKAENLAVDSAGNIYGAGYYSGSQTLGGFALKSAGARDVVAFKVDPAGKFKWAASAGGSNYDDGTGIAVTGAGDIRVAGTFEGKSVFGLPYLSLSASSTTDEDIFIWKPAKP